MDTNSLDFIAMMKVHSRLPRQGPGSDACTADALSRLPKLPSCGSIYDAGCGPGRSSLVLAEKLKRKIICLDRSQEFLAQLQAEAERKGLSEFVETRRGDMAYLNAPQESVDLIWSEGAIYCIGFDFGLGLWRSLLSKSGIVACTELSWLTDDVSPEPLQFWQVNYPGMRSVERNIESAESCGYKCLDHFTLPPSAWWDEYYGPLERNVQQLKSKQDMDEHLNAAIRSAEAEIDLYRRFGDQYGYEFYLFQKIE